MRCRGVVSGEGLETAVLQIFAKFDLLRIEAKREKVGNIKKLQTG